MKWLNTNGVGNVENIHFADLTSLQRHVRNSWSDWGATRQVLRPDIAQFGALTQNQQWIHTDDKRCEKESPYGAVIAHGLFILTLVPALLPTESFRVTGYQQRIVRGCNRFRFPAPVYPNEYVRARTKLLSVEAAASSKGTILTRAVEVQAEDRSIPVVTAELLLQYF